MKKHLPKKEKLPSEIFFQSWRLVTKEGRQYWQYRPTLELRSLLKRKQIDEKDALKALSRAFIYNKKKNHHATDAIYRDYQKPPKESSHKQNYPVLSKRSSKVNFEEDRWTTVVDSLVRGWDYYASLQRPEGHFPGDYGGPLFLVPGLALFSFVTDYDLGKPQVTMMKRYILNHQNSDGGWGLHIEGESIMFTTVLNYVALCLWDEESSHTGAARKWIRNNGGAVRIPSWGKYFLSLLGLYEWEGIDSLSPESWLFPKSFIFSPYRFWCHARMVYLPLSYLYGVRFRPSPEKLSNPIISRLRRDIYLQKYGDIDWAQHRKNCCSLDEYFPVSKLFKLLSIGLNFYEKIHLSLFRKKALVIISNYVDSEDTQTDYINIGPINKLYNALVIYHRLQNNPNSSKLRESWEGHCDRIKDYLWVAEDGMKMNGYNGSQFWDTAFTGRAMVALPQDFKKRYRITLKKIEKYLQHHRLSKGGWPFSTCQHSWPISDCSAEGLKLSLDLHKPGDMEGYAQFCQSVDFLLGLQNSDGGWPSYEVQGGPAWLESLNSSMIFGGIMVDYSYVECTSANIQALEKFHTLYTEYRSLELKQALARGREFIVSKQRPDGSWYGSWGVCFTYGIYFAVNGLIGSKNEGSRRALIQTGKFLLRQRNSDGSWGESYLSSSKKTYHSISGQPVNTAWAVLSLISFIEHRIYDDSLTLSAIEDAVDKGILFLVELQKINGDWPQSNITGVFNHNCMISYTNYRNIFPLWALGVYLDNFNKCV